MPPSNNIIVRPIGPLVAAASRFRSSLYRAPQSYIAGISDDLWPNPLMPVQPMGPPGADPLGWQMDWGRNLIFTPRSDAKLTAAELRELSTYPLARICIENNKDILCRIPHRIQLKPLPGETSKARASRSSKDDQLEKLNKFFDRPNPTQDWEQFLRPILDDMLVIDAASIFVGRNKKDPKKVQELRWIAGESITVLVEEHGWTPPPPSPAYQQLWQGYPRVDFTMDQLIYRPRNIVPRNTQASYLYGMSPTEQIAQEIQIGQLRLEFVKNYYTSGSIPGGMLFAPLGTPPAKIKEAQQWLDSDMAGQLAKRRQLQIVQGFQTEGKTEQINFPKEPELADAYDDLHTRRICFAYGTSPQRLMRQMNRASGQGMQESAEEEGTLPWLNWMKSLFDYIIQNIMGFTDYEFAFDPFQEMDEGKRALADASDIKLGLYTRNEVRERRGDDPRPEPAADELNVITAQGVVPLGQILVSGGGGGQQQGGGAGGAKPAATVTVSAGSSSGTVKANGHTTWQTCKKHADSYPRTHCLACVQSEAAFTANQKQYTRELHQ